MLAGIRDIMIITNPGDREQFFRLLGDGVNLGIKLTYAIQESPKGVAEAFLIAEEFINKSPVCLILGDNIFYGQGLGLELRKISNPIGATIFGYKVSNPEAYGIVEFNKKGQILSLEEKPINPKSSFAVPGIYFYDHKVVEIAKKIVPSGRGELEITSVNQKYLEKSELKLRILKRGTAWLDAGSFDSIYAASNLVKTIEDRQGYKISCPEEIAFISDWISERQLLRMANMYGGNPYGTYLKSLVIADSESKNYPSP
jgi:glucose-1-phosphate thymidylyltransferase